MIDITRNEAEQLKDRGYSSAIKKAGKRYFLMIGKPSNDFKERLKDEAYETGLLNTLKEIRNKK